MNKFCNEKLLPSLFARFQSRDPKYVDIPVSYKQAECLKKVMDCGKMAWTCEWNGRRVVLTSRGKYQFICFGYCESEKKEMRNNDVIRLMENDVKLTNNAIRRGKKDQVERLLKNYIYELQVYNDILKDKESGEDEIDEARIKVNHYSKLIDMLEGFGKVKLV